MSSKCGKNHLFAASVICRVPSYNTTYSCIFYWSLLSLTTAVMKSNEGCYQLCNSTTDGQTITRNLIALILSKENSTIAYAKTSCSFKFYHVVKQPVLPNCESSMLECFYHLRHLTMIKPLTEESSLSLHDVNCVYADTPTCR